MDDQDYFDSLFDELGPEDSTPDEPEGKKEPEPAPQPKKPVKKFKSLTAKNPKIKKPKKDAFSTDNLDDMLAEISQGNFSALTDEPDEPEPVSEEDEEKRNIPMSGVRGDPQTLGSAETAYIMSSTAFAPFYCAAAAQMQFLGLMGQAFNIPVQVAIQALAKLAYLAKEDDIDNFALIPIRNEEDFEKRCREAINIYRKVKEKGGQYLEDLGSEDE